MRRRIRTGGAHDAPVVNAAAGGHTSRVRRRRAPASATSTRAQRLAFDARLNVVRQGGAADRDRSRIEQYGPRQSAKQDVQPAAIEPMNERRKEGD